MLKLFSLLSQYHRCTYRSFIIGCIMLLITAIITISFQQQHIENVKDKTEHDVYQLSKELETQLQKPLYATESLKQLVFLERSAMKNQMLRNILNT